MLGAGKRGSGGSWREGFQQWSCEVRRRKMERTYAIKSKRSWCVRGMRCKCEGSSVWPVEAGKGITRCWDRRLALVGVQWAPRLRWRGSRQLRFRDCCTKTKSNDCSTGRAAPLYFLGDPEEDATCPDMMPRHHPQVHMTALLVGTHR